MIKIKPSTVKSLFHGAQVPQFHQMLNLWAVEDSALIGLDLQFSFLFEIVPPDLEHKLESELEGFFQNVKNFLHSLPENITLQFLIEGKEKDAGTIEQYLKTVSPQTELEKCIVEEKVRHLNSCFIQRRKHYLFVTTYPKDVDLAKFRASPAGLFKKDFKPVTEEMHRERINQLNELSSMVSAALSGCGIGARQMTNDEVVSFIYGYINPSRSEVLPSRPVRSDQTLRSQIALNACQSEFDLIYLDGFYYRAVNLHTRPGNISFAELVHFLYSLSPEFYFSITFHTGNQDRYVNQVHQVSTQAKNISLIHTVKRYHEAEQKAAAADQMIEHVKTTFQKLFSVSMCVIVKDAAVGQLTTKANEVVQHFRKISEAEGVIDDMNHLPLFLSALPNHSHLNFRRFLMHADAVGQALPLSSPWRGSKAPKILFQTVDQEILPLDLFDPTLEAKHAIILGSSGAGKSFACNYLLTNFLIESEKNHIVIVEPGHSYRKLCETFQGQYLQIELSEKFAFNPFLSREQALLNNSKDNFEVDPDVISYLTLLVQKMLNIKQLTGRQSTILENAITNTYKFAKMDPPLLSSLHYQLAGYKGDPKDEETAQEFSKNMEIWVTGRYGKLMNRPQSMSINARLVVFDLQNLDEQPELQSVIFFVIKNVIQSKLKDLSLRKIIVIDEGWKFFNDEVGSKLINDLYRTARKFNGAVYSISQNPADFLNTAAADSIIGNSSIKYILKLKTGHDLLSKFRLNETEIEEIKGLTLNKGKWSEVFLKFGEFARVLRIYPSGVDYWICTTDADDSMTEQKYKKEHPGDSQAQVLTGLARLRG